MKERIERAKVIAITHESRSKAKNKTTSIGRANELEVTYFYVFQTIKKVKSIKAESK